MFGGGFCRQKFGFFKILYSLKATKPGCSLLHISHSFKRNGKLYRAFQSHFVHFCTFRGSDMDIMWWAAENWTEYIHPKPPGYHIQPWPIPKSSYHCTHLFPLTLTNACRDTSSFIHPSKLLVHLHTHIPPCSRVFCNICSYKWMQLKIFPWFFANSEMPVRTEVVGRTWGARAFPLPLSCQSCCFFWLPRLREQRQTASWETWASVSLPSQGRIPW